MTDDTAQPEDMETGGSLFPGLDTAASAASPPAYRVLARKYRPKSFEELIGQDVMVRILTNSFALGRIHQAYLLTGVRGVGKTTTARILARALNYEVPAHDGSPAITQPTIAMPTYGLHCEAIIESRHVDIIEMDAASHTGVDDVREIIEAARYQPALARMKVYIIDEVHMLTKHAFNALLKTLEEPPAHVKFIFATTEIEKVPVTVRSRCLRFDLRRIEPDVLIEHLAKICRAEQVGIDDEALAMIARAAEGSVRDALSLLDQAIAQGGGAGTTAAQVRGMLGLADKGRIIDLFDAVMAGRVADALNGLSAQYDDGADPAQILLELAEFTHLVMRFKVMADAPARSATREERERALAFAGRLGLPLLDRTWQVLGKGIEEVRQSPRALAAADMVLVRLAHLADLPTPDDALRRLGFGAPQIGAPSETPTPSGGSSAPRLRASQGASSLREPMPEAIAAMPVETPRLQFATFADLVAKAGAEREIQLKNQLERDVRLVRFEDGTLEFSLAPNGSPQLAQVLMRRLQEWTGRRWIVAISTAEGEPSLREQADARRRAREHGVAQHPLVRSVMERFPGAAIVAVRSERDDAAPADMDAAADDITYDDSAPDADGEP
jgi:DNA polymerase-3 subunit gamma/tau